MNETCFLESLRPGKSNQDNPEHYVNFVQLSNEQLILLRPIMLIHERFYKDLIQNNTQIVSHHSFILIFVICLILMHNFTFNRIESLIWNTKKYKGIKPRHNFCSNSYRQQLQIKNNGSLLHFRLTGISKKRIETTLLPVVWLLFNMNSFEVWIIYLLGNWCMLKACIWSLEKDSFLKTFWKFAKHI